MLNKLIREDDIEEFNVIHFSINEGVVQDES